METLIVTRISVLNIDTKLNARAQNREIFHPAFTFTFIHPFYMYIYILFCGANSNSHPKNQGFFPCTALC